jgi:hypothetical protein
LTSSLVFDRDAETQSGAYISQPLPYRFLLVIIIDIGL